MYEAPGRSVTAAFPQYIRNPCTGELRHTVTQLKAATEVIFHDPGHPSSVSLPTRTR
ncbi:hypothetical protein GCM10022232_87270 [Streptomyces plumbiresistens]|uniref:Uncharacterized protein n=1 Tax=Streptomyces plumbiresistens TaxID=511811 RepID=A0ABP7TL96_9ACTN